MLVVVAILPPLLAAPLVAVSGRLGRASGWIALGTALVSTGLMGLAAASAEPFRSEVVTFAWVPSLGVEASFLVDGLSLFFGLVVTGIGALVFFYALYYLEATGRRRAEFFGYLLFFMGAMLGTVFSENLLLLVVFWELTGLASFLLIGFEHADRASRAAARAALLVTAGTGLALLAGVALLATQTGTLRLAELLVLDASSLPAGPMNAAFLLIAVGIFGKSAQFPFHFWLPRAMVAPTPVSTYLHSATMVQLGVFLTARLYPLFNSLETWTPVLVGVGFFTMLFGALAALLSHDLKALLAYATISQLGLFLGTYGLEDGGVRHDFAHLADHVLYKAGLFMIAGVIDHATGIRDLRRLGGLWRRLPWLGIATIATAGALAGLPGTIGWPSVLSTFEMAYSHSDDGAWWRYGPPIALTAMTAVNLALALRIVWSVFFASPRGHLAQAPFHTPGPALQAPALLLALGCVILGLWPTGLSLLLDPLLVTGLHAPDPAPLSFWPGAPAEALLVIGAAAAGGALFALGQICRWRFSIPRRLRLERHFDHLLDTLREAARRFTAAIRTDQPGAYLPITALTFVLLSGGWLAAKSDTIGLNAEALAAAPWPGLLRSLVIGLVAVALFLVVRLRRWSGQLIALSIVGFLLTFYYVLFRAPDLAMTQILIDSVTLILVLLLLVRFSHATELGERQDPPPVGRQAFNIALSTAVGLSVAALVYVTAARPHPQPVGEFYLSHTESLAHGRNAVNTVLVDFRGFDTLFEIVVLLLAALGALGLFMRYRRSREEYAAGASAPGGLGIDEVEKEEGL
ncbi:MAG TPA: hydrogen gas-evolving membrane-bound hydrogenase subunit E [Opitutus sp.]|nr:hydrogen gas-evolving membrane-bound hydrogenase subunit E [Opitutus sp.]